MSFHSSIFHHFEPRSRNHRKVRNEFRRRCRQGEGQGSDALFHLLLLLNDSVRTHAVRPSGSKAICSIRTLGHARLGHDFTTHALQFFLHSEVELGAFLQSTTDIASTRSSPKGGSKVNVLRTTYSKYLALMQNSVNLLLILEQCLIAAYYLSQFNFIPANMIIRRDKDRCVILLVDIRHNPPHTSRSAHLFNTNILDQFCSTCFTKGNEISAFRPVVATIIGHGGAGSVQDVHSYNDGSSGVLNNIVLAWFGIVRIIVFGFTFSFV
mmetsp:Transcript_7864/g.12490  ORF Transcript_7864/g.12490 Transcript_7864/m.12490 type:complete len:267 (+) Transcript_7864:113-913(+)